MIEQLNTAAAHFLQDDVTSVASGSSVMFLDHNKKLKLFVLHIRSQLYEKISRRSEPKSE